MSNTIYRTVAPLVERPPRGRGVAGSRPGHGVSKTLNIILVAS